MEEKLCAFCNQPFVPRSSYQRYCKRPHYMNCPVCGKKYLVTNNENLKRPPVACSYACRRAKADQTCLKKYGNKCAANGEEQRKLSAATMMDKYGVRWAFQSDELVAKGRETMLEKYGAEHPMHSDILKEKMAQTNITRYGTTTYLTSEEGKKDYEDKMLSKYGVLHPIQNSEIKEKIKCTNKTRYGNEWFVASDEGKRKIKEIVQQKYGVDYVTQLQSTRNKARETSLKRYGTSNPAKAGHVVEKIKQTMLERYGVEGVMSVPEIRERIANTSLERYGVPFYIMKPEVKLSSGSISKLNLRFADKLSERNINYEMEYRIESSSYDFYLPDKHMLIELNPSYTHNLIGNHWSKKGLKPKYHEDKCKLAIEKGFSIRCLFDWDNENELLAELTAESRIIDVKECKLYRLNKRAGVEFLSRCGRTRSKHYPKKMLIAGFVRSDEIVAAIAISVNKNMDYNTEAPYCILDYGLEWGFIDPENRLLRLLLDEIAQLIPLDEIMLTIDSDRIQLSDIEDLNLKEIAWIDPSIYWSRKTIRIPYTSNLEKTNTFLEQGWLPVEDCGRIVFSIRS